MSKRAYVQMPDELAEKLDRLAALMERPAAWVIEQAIARYIDDELEVVASIAKELADYKAGIGRNIPNEEVMREMDELIRTRYGDAAHLA